MIAYIVAMQGRREAYLHLVRDALLKRGYAVQLGQRFELPALVHAQYVGLNVENGRAKVVFGRKTKHADGARLFWREHAKDKHTAFKSRRR